MSKFRDTVVVLTGAGSGIGRALALALAREGVAGLALLDIDEEGLRATQQAIEAETAPPRVRTYVVDICFGESISQVRQAVEADFGRVSALYNVAGIAGSLDPFLEIPEEDFDRVLAVNFTALIAVTRAFLPLIVKEPWGCVVNISSMCGYWASMYPLAYQNVPYASSKFAVRGFTEALMVDMRHNHPNVTVHVVHPGFIRTDLVNHRVDVDTALVRAGKKVLTEAELSLLEKAKALQGLDASAPLEDAMRIGGTLFKEKLGIDVERCASEILSGVRRGHWRIVVGEDAKIMDAITRTVPSFAYRKISMSAVAAYAFVAIRTGRGGRFWLPGLALGTYAVKRGCAAWRAKL